MDNRKIQTKIDRCAVAPLFVFSCLLTCGCERKVSSTQEISSPDYDAQKEMIEHVIGTKLPDSVRNCKYHSRSYGMGRGTGWGYFEISGRDLSNLLNESDNLPDATELGQHPGIRFNIEKYLERTGENIAWWKPLTLRNRRYAQKIIGGEKVTQSFELSMLPVMDICVGEIQNDLMGIYLVYHCD